MHDTRLNIAYKLLPPPLSALPAKYHAPISLLLHSLSTGIIAEELARLAELEDFRELAFFLGVTHDIHQKLVEDGLATLKASKRYVRAKLDELGEIEYYRYIDDALENDACGKGIPVRGLPRELSAICHIGDMAQGSLDGATLLYWLRRQVGTLHPELTVRFYSVMIPQVFARSYIMERIYQEYIADADHLALASPWGLYVVTYEDELPEVLEASWDDLRIGTELIPYKDLVRIEESKSSATINKISVSGDEARHGLWSRFARMFYDRGLLDSGEPLYPVLPREIAGLFTNIRFTDVEFRDLRHEGTHTCALCGLPHRTEDSLVSNMFPKIANANVTTEKWNRFMPAHLKVKAWDSWGQWRNRIGLCPLCTLEALAIRNSGFTGKLTGVLAVSIGKPIPVNLLNAIGRIVALDHDDLQDLVLSLASPDTGQSGVAVRAGIDERLVLDYSSATIATQEVAEPKTENLFKRGTSRGAWGVFTRIGMLVSLGIYPVKFLPSVDTVVVDRPVLTPYNFAMLDFPVTSKRYGRMLPWIGPVLVALGKKERSEALQYLGFRAEHAPLVLLALNKSGPGGKRARRGHDLDVFSYDHVSGLLSTIG